MFRDQSRPGLDLHADVQPCGRKTPDHIKLNVLDYLEIEFGLRRAGFDALSPKQLQRKRDSGFPVEILADLTTE